MSTPRCTICDCERVPLDRENSSFGACTNIECRDPLYDYRSENPYKSVPKAADDAAPRPWTCTCAGRDKKVWHADPTCEVHGEGVAAPLTCEACGQPITNAQYWIGQKGKFRHFSTSECGVAAPLEPTRQELAEALQAEWASSGTFHFDFTGWLIEKVRCAAAVSKNLQEAYDREHAWLNNAATEANCDLTEVAGAIMQLKASLEQLCGDLKAIQQDYTNEKKRADNLQEERDKLKAELDLVDEALARRPALAHIEHRYNKIFAACAGAAKSERLEKEIAALRETK